MRAIRILSDCLVEWARAYPTDFAAPGAIGPLENLIRYVALCVWLLNGTNFLKHHGREFNGGHRWYVNSI